MVYERSIDIGSDTKLTINPGLHDSTKIETSITNNYNSIMNSLSVILQSNQHSTIIDIAKLVIKILRLFSKLINLYDGIPETYVILLRSSLFV